MVSLIRAWLMVLAALLLAGCDDGLSPAMSGAERMSGIEGTVTVVSAWPPVDSLYMLRVVAIRSYPPKDIIQEYLAGTLLFSDTLHLFTKTQAFSILQNGLNGRFAYIAVAQQYGPNIFQDWRVVGVYALGGDPRVPTPVDLGGGRIVSGIDITADFQSPPPQPF